LSKSISVPA